MCAEVCPHVAYIGARQASVSETRVDVQTVISELVAGTGGCELCS